MLWPGRPARNRAGGVLAVTGGATRKLPACQAGDIVAVAKIDAALAGQVLSADGKPRAPSAPAGRRPLYALAIEAKDRKDREEGSMQFHPAAVHRLLRAHRPRADAMG